MPVFRMTSQVQNDELTEEELLGDVTDIHLVSSYF